MLCAFFGMTSLGVRDLHTFDTWYVREVKSSISSVASAARNSTDVKSALSLIKINLSNVYIV